VNKPYIVTFPGVRGTSGQFIVMADDQKGAIEMAWKSTDWQLQITHEKQPPQVKEFKRGVLKIA
jgi:hypothetical protein